MAWKSRWKLLNYYVMIKYTGLLRFVSGFRRIRDDGCRMLGNLGLADCSLKPGLRSRSPCTKQEKAQGCGVAAHVAQIKVLAAHAQQLEFECV